MRIHIEAYGCAMNRGEAEEFTDAVLEAGHTLADGENEAEALAIFTCGVIETTERRLLKRIGGLARFGKPLIVGGCLPAICRDRILKAAPGAMLLGPAEHIAGIAMLDAAVGMPGAGRASAVGILPIATGCLGGCTYCITRQARGALRSRPEEMLVQRLRALISGGAVEVQLCAQDTAAYGIDIGGSLGALVRELGKVEGDHMIRIGMMNPATVLANLDGILEAYGHPRIFKFLHLPVQSGSDAVLERMGRRHTVEDFKSIVASFRERFPGMALSTDVIIGFPGETEADFKASMELMHEVRPDIINVTRFSARPGTAAHAMRPKVPGWKAKDWSREMTELRFRITSETYSGMKGTEMEALATERRKPGTTFLRSRDYRPIVVKGEVALGDWGTVIITGKARTHLTGRIVAGGKA